SLLGAILSSDPPPMPVKPVTPPWLERLVRRCLQKEPDDRYQSVRDIVLDLRLPPADTASAKVRSNWLPWAAAAAFLVVAVTAWGLWLRGRAGPSLPVAFTVEPPAGASLPPLGVIEEGSAISPDGRTLAFVATNQKSETRLYVRPLDSLDGRALPGTEAAGNPFWSPDSKTVA